MVKKRRVCNLIGNLMQDHFYLQWQYTPDVSLGLNNMETVSNTVKKNSTGGGECIEFVRKIPHKIFLFAFKERICLEMQKGIALQIFLNN